MASAVLSEPHTRPEPEHRLSLCVDIPPSASPFPSPSSSFIPPPMPGAHEFALKIAGKNVRKKTMDDKENRDKDKVVGRDKDVMKMNGVTPPDVASLSSSKSPQTPMPSLPVANEPNTDVQARLMQSRSPSPPSLNVAPSTPTMSEHSSPQIPDPLSPPASAMKLDTAAEAPSVNPDILSALATPTRSNLFLPLSSTTDHTNSTDCPSPVPSPVPSPSAAAFHHPHRDSLTSSRPAPPSPSVSRRASTAHSTSSNRSRSSRPPSASFSRTNSNRLSHRSSQLGQVKSASPRASVAWATQDGDTRILRPRMVLVQIRDFAYALTDERHRGGGADVPKPNRLKTLNRRLRVSSMSVSSVASSGDEDDEDDGADDSDSWNKLSSGFARLSMQLWGNNSTTKGASSTPEFPSSNDFERNFLPGDGANEDYYGAEDGFDPDAEEDDEGGLIHHEEGPLYPGLYRAMYAFEPEGTAEMALEEDQIVRVVGRGGGVGWAIVERHYVHPEPGAKAARRKSTSNNGGYEASSHALVPESYLEVYQLDEEEDNE